MPSLLPTARTAALRIGPVLMLALAACADGTGPGSAVRDLSRPWQRASAEQVGGDAGRLDAAVALAASTPLVTSLAVVRRGRLVAEHHAAGVNASTRHDVRSVTKSIVGLLTGIARERGHIASLDQPLADFDLGEACTPTPQQAAVTIRHMLTMSAGFDWIENGAVGYNEWILSGRPVCHLLDRAIVTPPGQEFGYNSALVHLLGRVLVTTTGRELDAFAADALLGPLGISAGWEPLHGQINGGSGLDITTLDLARIGQLMLQNGRSGTRRILPPGWADASVQPHFVWRSTVGPLDRVSYARLWWTSDDPAGFFALGYGGQLLFVAPEIEAVIVVTTDWRADAPPAVLSNRIPAALRIALAALGAFQP